jgi:hypothetical protein
MPAPVARLIKEHGLSQKELRTIFEGPALEKDTPSNKLVERIRDCVRTGIERNRKDYRLYKAMDWAYDQAFSQVSMTQLRGLMSTGYDDSKVLELANSWGLTHLLPDVEKDGQVCCDPTTKKPLKALNLPVFFNLFVPVVMSYITIRWGKLFLDRNQTPHFKYSPSQYTVENRLRCEVVTQAVQKMSTWFDYAADTKQSILQTLIYGFCINFPREAWFTEKQEDEKGEAKIVREGLRFNQPHPSRVYYDLYNRLSTLNSNSGCDHVGYWQLRRYQDVKDNDLYWNKDKISFGALSWFDFAKDLFSQEVAPCNMTLPGQTSDGAGGTGAMDRENEAAKVYGQGHYAAPTLETNHFHRLIPKEHGLGTYEHPIWMRFVVGSDNAVLFAEPLATDVFPTYTYDADFNRSRFRSMALEALPFQDHIGQVLSQWCLSVKENLNNPIFYDKDKISTEDVKKLENLGQKTYGRRVFIGFSSTENVRMRQDQREAIYSPDMTRHNTAELPTLLNGILGILDRILQFSPQEIGQAASHEQTAEENRIIDRNMSTRVAFTDTGIDAAENAKKKMAYDAMMAYADDNITVGIGSAFVTSAEQLKSAMKKVGIEFEDNDSAEINEDGTVTVKAKKSSLAMESFAANRGETNRIDEPAVADAMAKIFIAIAGNPVLIQSIGAPQLVELLNQIIVVAGLPKEFRLRGQDVPTDPQAQAGAAGQPGQPGQPGQQTSPEVVAFIQQQLEEFANLIRGAIDQSQQQTMEAAAQAIKQSTEQNAQIDLKQQQDIDAIVQQLAALANAVTATQAPPPPAPVLTPPTAPMIGVPA